MSRKHTLSLTIIASLLGLGLAIPLELEGIQARQDPAESGCVNLVQSGTEAIQVPCTSTGGDGGPFQSVESLPGSVYQTVTQVDGTTITLNLPPGSSITETQTITSEGSTITVAPLAPDATGGEAPSDTHTQIVTQPGGDLVTLTLPPGSTITGPETVTKDGSTLTVEPTGSDDQDTNPPPGSVTSTITTTPAGLSIQDYTDQPVTENTWITTTGQDQSSTILPVILPCSTCQPEMIWGLDPVPNVEFDWPDLPNLPTFHFPCVMVFGIHVAGECTDPSGPGPIVDSPPPQPKPANSDPPGDNPPDDNPPDDNPPDDNPPDDNPPDDDPPESCETPATVTDHFVSCDESSSQCTTTSEATRTGCSITASDTTETEDGPACTLDTRGIDPPTTIYYTGTGGTDSDGGAVPPPPTGAPGASFIDCSARNQDPGAGITDAYCVCSGSTFEQLTNTDPNNLNSCAYTTMPTSTLASPIQTITKTSSEVCSVCTYVGQSEACSSIGGCVPEKTAEGPTETGPPPPPPSDGAAPDDPCRKDNEGSYTCSVDKGTILYCSCANGPCDWVKDDECQGGVKTCHRSGDNGNFCGPFFSVCC